MNNLLAETLAEIREVPCGTMVCKGQYHYGISAKQCGRQGPFHWGRFGAPENRGITPFRELDDDLVAVALVLVIAGQANPKPSRLNSHNGVHARIEVNILAKDIHTDEIFF
jgi:hypothetical protein